MSRRPDALTIAKCLAGPNTPLPENSKFTLQELRDARWNRLLTPAERAQYLLSATMLLKQYTVTEKPVIKIGKSFTEREASVFQAVPNSDSDWCAYSSQIAQDTGMEQRIVLNVLRSLKRKHFVELVPLFGDDDGLTRGSGWRATTHGENVMAHLS